MRRAFEIDGSTVAPGTRARLEIPLGRLVTQQMLSLPLIVVHGATDGPVIWLSAAIHGDEIHGTEVIRRALAKIDAKALSGTVLAMPVVNVWGFVHQSRYFPDRRDLNRSFPGSKRGSLAGQIAHLLLEKIIGRCDYGVDLHAGSNDRTNVPQARGNLDDPKTAELCMAFAAPFTIHGKLRPGSLRHAANRRGIPCVLYEAGEPHRFDEDVVAHGTAGVLRVMRHVGMIEDAPPATPSQVSRSTYWIRATRSGIAHLEVGQGDIVEAGASLGVIRDPYGDITARLKARAGGAVIGHSLNALVNRGDAVVHIAELPAADEA